MRWQTAEAAPPAGGIAAGRTCSSRFGKAALHGRQLYPEDRGCPAPTTCILETFAGVARHELSAPGTALRTCPPEFTDLPRQVLDLLDISTSVYSPITRMALKPVREVRHAVRGPTRLGFRQHLRTTVDRDPQKFRVSGDLDGRGDLARQSGPPCTGCDAASSAEVPTPAGRPGSGIGS